MPEIVFLNTQKEVMMKWSEFFLYKDEYPLYASFNIELNVSIFTMKKKYESNIDELKQLAEDLKLMKY